MKFINIIKTFQSSASMYLSERLNFRHYRIFGNHGFLLNTSLQTEKTPIKQSDYVLETYYFLTSGAKYSGVPQKVFVLAP